MTSYDTNDHDTNDQIFSLLPSISYTLAYTIPLIVLSTLLTFSGAFLMLDRTRTFPQQDSFSVSLHPTKRTTISSFWYRFIEGGVGGVASGYAFGVHTATFLSLLIPSVTTCASLTPGSFMAVWIFPSILCSVLSGRWKYVTLSFAGISGFTTFALALSVIVHPSLLTRIILTAIFVPVGTLLCLLPRSQYSHVLVRFTTSATGAFGLVFSIALIARNMAWGNIWERYWIRDSVLWGTSKEKGLSAAYCILLLAGIVCDWFLHNKLGENPDERWDHCLADYSNNLPNDHNRAGEFTPLTPWWNHIWGNHTGTEQPISHPLKKAAGKKLSFFETPNKLHEHHHHAHSHDFSARKLPGSLLTKDCQKSSYLVSGRQEIRFSPKPVNDFSDSDEELSEEGKQPMKFPRWKLSHHSALYKTAQEEDLTEMQNDNKAFVPHSQCTSPELAVPRVIHKLSNAEVAKDTPVSESGIETLQNQSRYMPGDTLQHWPKFWNDIREYAKVESH